MWCHWLKEVLYWPYWRTPWWYKRNFSRLKLQNQQTLVLARYLQKLAGSRCFYFLCTKRTQWQKSLWSMQRLHCAQHVTWKAKLARIWVVSFFYSINFFFLWNDKESIKEKKTRVIEQKQKKNQSTSPGQNKPGDYFYYFEKEL